MGNSGNGPSTVNKNTSIPSFAHYRRLVVGVEAHNDHGFVDLKHVVVNRFRRKYRLIVTDSLESRITTIPCGGARS